MGMKLDDLHAIIDTAQMGNRDTEFEVGVVDLSTDRARVYQIEEVYVDSDAGVVSLVISVEKPVGGNRDKETVNV